MGDEYEVLIDAITNKDSALDKIGITVKLSDMPSSRAEANARRAFYGTSRVSRFWKKYVRSRMFQKKHARLWQEYLRAQVALQMDVLNAVIKAGEDCQQKKNSV